MTARRKILFKNIAIASAILFIIFTILGVLLAINDPDATLQYKIFITITVPLFLLIATSVVLGVIYLWFRIWFWWLPNWLAFIVGLPQKQAVALYGFILFLLGIVSITVTVSIVGPDGFTLFGIVYGVIMMVSLWRVWQLFVRTPFTTAPYLTRLDSGEKPNKAQLATHPGKNGFEVARLLTYARIQTESPELPDYSTLESQLFACMQSYASLQQGVDTEDTRLSHDLRAAVMSQYIDLAASNLRHVFFASDFSLTHLKRVKNPGQQGSSYAVFGAIIMSNVSEAILSVEDASQPKMPSIPTPFYVSFSMQSGQIFIYEISLQESQLERSLHLPEIAEFAHASKLLYVPRLAPFLLPKAGLLASSGLLRKWSLASNFVTGHTNTHAFYLLSVQPYIRYHRDATYVMGATVVPKRHDRIIIADKRSALYHHAQLLPIQRISTESSDFSTRFGIFIGQESTVPSLELINPAFMAQLLELSYEISIEVIGKHIYIYLPTKEVSKIDFDTVLHLMKLAHKELRL